MEPSIRDKAAVAGIGQTRFSRSLGLSELEMAAGGDLESCDDAGISPSEIDGLVRYDIAVSGVYPVTPRNLCRIVPWPASVWAILDSGAL